MTLGNGVVETAEDDNRLRITLLEAKAADQTKLLGLNYTYYNNSNVAAQRITGLVLDVTENYTYDRKNRLADAREDDSVWTRVFGYDAWGNGWVESGTGVPIDPFTPRNSSWFNGQNRLVNVGLNINYDTTGNQKAIGAYTFNYDGENRLAESTINAASVTYASEGEGRQVKRATTNGTTVYV